MKRIGLLIFAVLSFASGVNAQNVDDALRYFGAAVDNLPLGVAKKRPRH